MRALKVAVVGTRGVPGVAGGVESHCEALYPRLAAMGYEILILRRKAYVGDGITSWKGVVLKDLWCPRRRVLRRSGIRWLPWWRRGVQEQILYISAALGPP